MYGMAAVESRLCSQIVAPGIVSAPRTRRFPARMGLARDPGGRARATGRHAEAPSGRRSVACDAGEACSVAERDG
jgi:hypothetical protein